MNDKDNEDNEDNKDYNDDKDYKNNELNELTNINKDLKRKAIFIDRDGVVNYNRDDYVKSWDEFEFIPSAPDAIKKINDSETGFES